jgi:very-short-patch-repair endonuclease
MSSNIHIPMSLKRDPKLLQIIKENTRLLRKNSTKAERILWEELRNRKFFNKKFYRQHPIITDLSRKETFYIIDFYCNEKKLGIELDGEIHKFKEAKDEDRTDILNKMGIKIIRFKNSEVEDNLKSVSNAIRAVIKE